MNLVFDLDKIIFKKIRQTLELNKKTIDYPGKKFYYSPQITKFTCFMLIAFMLVAIWNLFANKDLYSILVMIGIGYFLINMIHKLLFKNPIFIINGDQLYYTKMDQWFDLKETIIYETHMGKNNFWGTLVIETQKWEKHVHENLWYIEYDKDLIKLLYKYLKKNKY